MPSWELLLGPYGLTVLLLVIVVALARDHLRSDSEDRRQRDLALEGWKAQTDANALAAAAAEKDASARLAAAQHGRTDDAK